MNDRQAQSSEKQFLSPSRGSNPQHSYDQWDAQTIELPRLRWWANVEVRHTCDLSGSHNMLIILLMWCIFWKCGSLEISWMIDKRSSSSILRKTISEPQTGIKPATSWWLGRRSNHWATKTQMVSSSIIHETSWPSIANRTSSLQQRKVVV